MGIFGGPLTPIQAQGFDQKVDDGLPASGAVSLMLSRAPPSPIIMPPQAGRSVSPNISIQNILDEDGSLAWRKADDCAVNNPPLVYTHSQAKVNLPYCSLRIRAAF